MCKCKVCGKENYPIDTKKFPKDFCSYKCYEEWQKFHKTPNCKCSVCDKPMYLKPSRIKRAKNGITCSIECASKLKSQYMQGEGNHQYGLIGDKNASFKGEEVDSEYGYVLVYCPNHPFPHDKSVRGSRVFKHRLVIEENSNMFNPIYFFEIDGKKYLKPEYSVHHINENKKDNTLENLEIVSRSEHTSIHNKEKEIIRDNRGRIVGVIKSGKIGEGCDANPESNSKIAKGLERCNA
jgi:hypothetical protein